MPAGYLETSIVAGPFSNRSTGILAAVSSCSSPPRHSPAATRANPAKAGNRANFVFISMAIFLTCFELLMQRWSQLSLNLRFGKSWAWFLPLVLRIRLIRRRPGLQDRAVLAHRPDVKNGQQ